MAKKLRYKLHWNGNDINPKLKWAIYDWHLICIVAYMENRAIGRKICNLLNTGKN